LTLNKKQQPCQKEITVYIMTICLQGVKDSQQGLPFGQIYLTEWNCFITGYESAFYQDQDFVEK